MTKRRTTDLRKTAVFGVVSLLCTGTGCSLQEALIDGLYGGISDTVAAIVSGAAAAAVGGGTVTGSQ